MKPNYLFTSHRLGFREWSFDDLNEFALLNSDKEVMRHFPKPLSREETYDFILRLQKHFKQYGHNYYAVEIKATNVFIGFIGLAYQTYESKFTPNVDIGWRLKKIAWNNGFATEGANRCLEIAFNNLQLEKVISTCTVSNINSEKVMRKIGMSKVGVFEHPNLKNYPKLQTCLLYEINRQKYESMHKFST